MESCYRCSMSLEQGAIWCQNCECFQPDVDKKNICVRCRMYVPTGAEICLSCGLRLSRTSEILKTYLPMVSTAATILVAFGVLWKALDGLVETPSKVAYRWIDVDVAQEQIRFAATNIGELSAYVLKSTLTFQYSEAEINEVLRVKSVGEEVEDGAVLERGTTIVALAPDSGASGWKIEKSLEGALAGSYVVGYSSIVLQGELKIGSLTKCEIKVEILQSSNKIDEYIPTKLDFPIEKCAEFVRNVYK